MVAILKLGSANAYYHLKPIALNPEIETVWVVRPSETPLMKQIEKCRFVDVAMNDAKTMAVVVHRKPPANPPTRAERNRTRVFGMNLYRKVKMAIVMA